MTALMQRRRLGKLSAAVLLALGLGNGPFVAVQAQESVKVVSPTDGTSPAEIDRLVVEANVERGEKVARVCGDCHGFAPGGGHRVGPNLHSVAGRPIASAPGFPYSQALTGKIGETWTNQNLDAFLANPGQWAPGTKMTFPGLPKAAERLAVIAYLRSLTEAAAQGPATGAEPAAAEANQRLVRDGLVVNFSVTPLGADDSGEVPLMAGTDAVIQFRITDQATGVPVSGLFPGAWMDITAPWGSERESDRSCKDRVGLYLQGNVGIRPLIDMNGYYLLSLNEDATITVIDPFVGIAGITKLFALIDLKRPGADWVKSSDHKRFFVTMPQANQVAVVDTEIFKVSDNVDAGVHPVRIAMQPDEKYLWVGNDSKLPAESGVTVIDTGTLKPVAQIPTGEGHHEIAFTDDSRYAFVSNRKSGTVSVIEVQSLAKLRDIETGSLPLSLAYSPMSKALYVSDGQDGAVSVIDPETQAVMARIAALQGLGPMRFTPDGRWGLVINSEHDLVHVIDASSNRIAQDVSVGTRPFQIAFSRAFAYVRSLGTERVSMFSLEDLNKGRKPPVMSFQAGQKPPELTPELNLADIIVEAPGEAAVMVASSADATVYFYMEGMNAPMGNFRNYGHRPLAVDVVDRALRERLPGVYAATARLPEAGTYEVAFLMESPQILHCFSVAARPNPALPDGRKRLAVEYLVEDKRAPVGKEFALQFRLTDPRTGQLQSGLGDVRVLSYRAPSFDRSVVLAEEVGDGLYEAHLRMRRPGAYYVFVSSPSAEAGYHDLKFLTLMGIREKTAIQGSNRSGG